MTSFLFWNVMKKDLRAAIADLAAEQATDVLLVAESGASDESVAAALRTATGLEYTALSSPEDKVRIFTRLPPAGWSLLQRDAVVARMAIWNVVVGRSGDFMLVVVHLASKSNYDAVDQALLAAEVAEEIRRVENVVGHTRTLIVGDLNMNPFEPGVTAANALHGVMTRRIAEQIERRVQGKSYRFFYNPMWGCFGDRTDGPPGTYYHRSPQVAETFWHTFDQVLLRPDLMNQLEDLVILDHIRGEPLVTHPRGLPRADDFSDHLPIAFRLSHD